MIQPAVRGFSAASFLLLRSAKCYTPSGLLDSVTTGPIKSTSLRQQSHLQKKVELAVIVLRRPCLPPRERLDFRWRSCQCACWSCWRDDSRRRSSERRACCLLSSTELALSRADMTLVRLQDIYQTYFLRRSNPIRLPWNLIVCPPGGDSAASSVFQ